MCRARYRLREHGPAPLPAAASPAVWEALTGPWETALVARSAGERAAIQAALLTLVEATARAAALVAADGEVHDLVHHLAQGTAAVATVLEQLAIPPSGTEG